MKKSSLTFYLSHDFDKFILLPLSTKLCILRYKQFVCCLRVITTWNQDTLWQKIWTPLSWQMINLNALTILFRLINAYFAGSSSQLLNHTKKVYSPLIWTILLQSVNSRMRISLKKRYTFLAELRSLWSYPVNGMYHTQLMVPPCQN